MGCYTFGICRDKALELKAKHNLDVFVETGTLVGHTAQWAAGHFSTVITVEITKDEKTNEMAKENLKGLSNVQAVVGDSAEFMEGHEFPWPCMFWLDAHDNYSCPVLREIAAINKSPLRHVILVDDVNQFGVLQHWPTKAEAIMALVDGGRRTVYEFQDVFVAEPCP